VKPATSAQAHIGFRFESLLGSQFAITDPLILDKHAIDCISPHLVVRPGSAEQITAVLRIANEEDWSVAPYGGGTRQYVGRTPERVDIVLSTDRLNQIETYDPGDLTISLQAGVSVDHVTRTCADNRQLLPVETASGSTIGGAVAVAHTGPLRTGFGGLRDFCIGISFITGDGLGGRGGGRVVKNVAGYDLMKLMIGSYGTLGIITSANFKVFPLPQRTATCICDFESLTEALKFRDRLLNSPLTPIAAELVSPEAIEYLGDAEPRDPDHWAPATPVSSRSGWQIALRFGGSERMLERCRREVSSFITRELNSNGAEEADFWRHISGFEQRVSKRHRNAMIFHVDVPIGESHIALEAAQTAAVEYNLIAAIVGRGMLGSFEVAFLPLAIDPPGVMQFAGAASNFRSRLSKASSAVVVRCPLEAKQHFDVWGSTPSDTVLMQKIKRALDPKGILNRGRFLVG
jgi:glycolate oxidase FAD binding subunit